MNHVVKPTLKPTLECVDTTEVDCNLTIRGLDMIDAVAEALCNAEWGNDDAWDVAEPFMRDEYRRVAQVAIEAMGLAAMASL